MHEGGGITYTTTLVRHWQGQPGMDQHCSSSDQHGDHLAVKQLVCRYVAARREQACQHSVNLSRYRCIKIRYIYLKNSTFHRD